MDHSVTVLSSDTDDAARRYQLSPVPTRRWWTEFDRHVRRWRTEAGRVPPSVSIEAHDEDELVARGVTEELSLKVDKLVTELVRTVNRSTTTLERRQS